MSGTGRLHIRRLVTQGAPAAAAEAQEPLPTPESVSPASPVRVSVSLLESLGPIFRAALVYPGVEAPPGAWAGAVRRMSQASTQLTDQLAQLHPEEIDIAWARRELHPAVVKLVAEFWIAGLLRQKGISSVDDVPLPCEEMLQGLLAAERAVQAPAAPREPVPFSVATELLPALALLTLHAQTYTEFLRANAGAAVEISLGTYLTAVADAAIAAVMRGAERAQMPGLDRQVFTSALLGASTGIVVKACEIAINELLQQFADARKEGSTTLTIPESGFPILRTTQLIDAGISRLAGTYAYVASQLGATHG